MDVGNGVVKVKVGDIVCLPFNIACGFCPNCEKGLTGFCLSVNPAMPGGAYGYPTWAATRAVRPSSCASRSLTSTAWLPEDAREKEADYVMLADIWPTGWHGTELAWRGARRLGGDLRWRAGPGGPAAAPARVPARGFPMG